MKQNLQLMVAPMQGYTDVVWRHAHASMSAEAVDYYTPFIRLERGAPRQRDMRRLASPLNVNHRLTPQIIFRDIDEFRSLVSAVVAAGYNRVDLNMGCPFPPQVKHGRGAATLPNRRLLSELADEMKRFDGILFSVKMRLGVDATDQWRDVIDVINGMPLSHLTVHPRMAVSQYDGPLDEAQLDALLVTTSHRVIYNGEIKSPYDIDRVIARFPSVAGVMVGRGLLARPTLFDEWRSGREMDSDARLERLVALHDRVFEHYAATLCGDDQVLSNIKPYWEYAPIDRRSLKAIRKSATIPRYLSAVRAITFDR